MTSSVCANNGRSVCSDVTDLSETWCNPKVEKDDLVAAENSLLKKEEVWVFDMPDEEEMNRKDDSDLLEDFPDSKDRDGCGESELYEDFPNRYECDDDDDDESIFSVAKSVSSVLSAISNLSLGSKRSTRSTRSTRSLASSKRYVKNWFGNSFKEPKSAKKSEKTLELTDDSTSNQQDGESENKEALAMLEDQTEFFDIDPVDKLVNKMTYSTNRRLRPLDNSSVEQKSSQLPSDNDEIKGLNDNPLEELMKKLKPTGVDKLEDSFSLLPPDLLYEADQIDDIDKNNDPKHRQDHEKANDTSNENDNDELGALPTDVSFEGMSHEYGSISSISLMKIYGQGCMPSIAERSERSLRTDRSGRSLLTARSEALSNK
mmetsp:Transcript_434/g.623  ORF Transcript_434/g.623 Transcript_434/m.623 type:complete len:374 (-) Transcript_434:185-1306(-)